MRGNTDSSPPPYAPSRSSQSNDRVQVLRSNNPEFERNGNRRGSRSSLNSNGLNLRDHSHQPNDGK